MKIKTVPEIIRKRWNILVYIWFRLMIIVFIYGLSQPSFYQTDGSIIIRPQASLELDRNVVRALDTLSRGDEIGSTFSEIFTSNQILRSAVKNLEIPPELQVGLQVKSSPIAGTNILEVKVTGNDPDTVIAFANEVTVETMKRVAEIYNVFELEYLDNFLRPLKPVRSNTEIIAVGFFLAVIVSVGLVLFGEAVLRSGRLYDYLDFEPLLDTRRYFDYRLKQEISHSKHVKYKFCIAMIKAIDHSGKELSSIVLGSFSELVQEEDVPVIFEPNTLGIIFPGSTAYSIYRKCAVLFEIKKNTSDSDGEDRFKAGIVEYANRDLDGRGLIDLAFQSLIGETSDRKKKIYYFTNVAGDNSSEKNIENEKTSQAVNESI